MSTITHMTEVLCVKCGQPAAFPRSVEVPFTCITCQPSGAGGYAHEMPVPALQPFQQRVVDESCELEVKVAKLDAFYDSEKFCEVPQPERLRLGRQLRAMKEYAAILKERIAAFTS